MFRYAYIIANQSAEPNQVRSGRFYLCNVTIHIP